MNKKECLTKSELHKATNAPGYVIIYLKDCNRLPIVQESQGRGYPTLYAPEAIQIVKDHMNKRNSID